MRQKRGGIRIPPRNLLSWPRWGGVLKKYAWVTAGIDPACTLRAESK
jgi:hypothetical protein